LVGSVNADSGAAEGAPGDADGVFGARGEEVELGGADAVVEDTLIPPEGGHGGDADDAPFSGRGGERGGARGDGEAGEEFVSLPEVEDALFAIDADGAAEEFRDRRKGGLGADVLELEGFDVGNLDGVADLELGEGEFWVEEGEEFGGAVETFGQKFGEGFVGEVLFFRLVGGFGGVVADETLVLWAEGVGGVQGEFFGQGKVVRLPGGLESFGLLEVGDGLGGELSGEAVEFAGTKQGAVEEDLNLEDGLAFREGRQGGGGGAGRGGAGCWAGRGEGCDRNGLGDLGFRGVGVRAEALPGE
jgi:hypothetical protein